MYNYVVFILLFRLPHIKDLEALEPAFYNSLLWIQENDPEPLDLTFTVEEASAYNPVELHGCSGTWNLS